MAEMPDVYVVDAVPWAQGWELHIRGVGVTQTDEGEPTSAEAAVREYLSVMLQEPAHRFKVQIRYPGDRSSDTAGRTSEWRPSRGRRRWR
jgi:hypothetical protein